MPLARNHSIRRPQRVIVPMKEFPISVGEHVDATFHMYGVYTRVQGSSWS